jgi:hypothetical protein
MKQIFRRSLKGLFREANACRIKDVLTCCRTVVHQYCRIEPMTQCFILSLKWTFESLIKQSITDKNHSLFIQVKTQ